MFLNQRADTATRSPSEPAAGEGASRPASFLAAIAALAILCAPLLADTVTLSGTTNVKYVPALPISDNRIYDATQWTSTAVGPPSAGGTTSRAVQIGSRTPTALGPKNLTWRGGVIIGAIPPSWSWRKTHDFGGVGVDLHNNTYAECALLRVHNVEDGMKPREAPEWTNHGSFLVRDCYFTAIRDDCIENDRFEPGTVRDCLFDGVHTFISEQKESGFPRGAVSIGPDEDAIIYVTRVYVRLYPTNAYDASEDDHAGAGKWFKWKGDAKAPNHRVRIESSVFAVGVEPRSGWRNLDIPPEVTWGGSDNFILWLGPPGTYRGPMPGAAGSNVPGSVTFLEGASATDKWQQVRNDWLTRHGLPSQDNLPADYNPHTLTHFPPIATPSVTTTAR